MNIKPKLSRINTLASTPAAIFSAVTLILAGCATPAEEISPPTHKPPPPRVTVPEEPIALATPGLNIRQRTTLAIDLLDQGDEAKAKAEIVEILNQDPENTLAASLLKQIVTDPKVLLGDRSFTYTIRSGETLSQLASRYLGDRFLFWSLAKYNGIPAPNRATAGDAIQIPGVARQVPARPPIERPAARPPKAEKPKPAHKAPERDPTKAGELRGRALELMNAGQIERAVRLLRQALSLDPGNAMIKSDLERAKRILASVRG